MTVASPVYEWIKQLPTALFQLDEISLEGSPPPFPWKQLSAKLGEALEAKDLMIAPTQIPEWRTEENLYQGMGDHPLALTISLAPEGGLAYWVMAKQDVVGLLPLLLTQQQDLSEEMDPDFLAGFYRFLAVETLYFLPQIGFDKTLSTQLLDSQELPKGTFFCQDISITLHERTLWGRLILSKEVQRQWKAKYAKATLDIPLSAKIDFHIDLEIGRLGIHYSQWKTVKAGDFLLFDKCSLRPDGEGLVLLKTHGMPLFKGELQQGNIKILENASYSEAEDTMTDDDQQENAQVLPEKESAFDEESEFEEEEHIEEEEHAEEEHAEEENEIWEEETQQEKWPPPPEKRTDKPAPPSKAAEESSSIQKEKLEHEEKVVSIAEVPFYITVEVGRVRMSLQKLTSLQPGNVLELNVRPENGVDLMVNGKRIGKGELLLIGETLGVRILDMG